MGWGPGKPRALLIVLLQPLCTSDAAAGGSRDRKGLLCCGTEPALAAAPGVRGVPSSGEAG